MRNQVQLILNGGAFSMQAGFEERTIAEKVILNFLDHCTWDDERILSADNMGGIAQRGEDLLPCPGCKSKNVSLGSNFDRVQCGSCGITGPFFDGHPLDAISGWNAMPRDMV